ncbi:Gfo/Idh/MocA family protein [Paenibacillus methanolicus]|uniref:Putative dehydrogenase n=1 Tax=Paenibacillus methanolicus TaxID=582686 RepID=A0A5S5CE42_9BACL|nr:Gfo/Idh/MocA family oxidoreductase [Paenibacillus methanolicus]TYP76586.1 putative dehydrogenase [Paenibacillus methanolicus]
MTKLRVAIIGCGAITYYRYAPEYASHPEVEIAAFCDVIGDRADGYVQQYGGRAFTDYRAMLEEIKPDLVTVCTPNVFHAEMTIAAANAGAHVLVEKPMATNAEEAEAMIAAARRNGVQLMVGQSQRLMPPHLKAKELLSSGRLGSVLTFRCSAGHKGPETWSVDGRDSWFFRKNEAAMGAAGDLGIHKADLIRWLLDDEVAEVSAYISNLDKAGSDVDDNLVASLRMNSGALGTLVASWTYYQGEDNTSIFWCEHGTLKIGFEPDFPVIVQLKDGTVEKYGVGGIATNDNQLRSGVVDSFVDGIRKGNAPFISGEEGLRSLKVILAAFVSALTGKAVTP